MRINQQQSVEQEKHQEATRSRPYPSTRTAKYFFRWAELPLRGPDAVAAGAGLRFYKLLAAPAAGWLRVLVFHVVPWRVSGFSRLLGHEGLRLGFLEASAISRFVECMDDAGSWGFHWLSS